MASVTVNPGQIPSALGQNYGYDNVVPPFYLNGAVVTVAGASLPAITIPAYNTLRVVIWVPSIGGSDVPGLRFNGDTGANYNSRSDTLAVGSALVTNAENASDTMVRLGAAATTGRMVIADIGNTLNQNKVVNALVSIAGANAATVPVTHAAACGVWFNTTAQITSITLLSQAGQNLGVGTSIQIFGGY